MSRRAGLLRAFLLGVAGSGCGTSGGPPPGPSPGWQPATILESPPVLATDSEPRLALDPAGHAVALWLQEQDSNAGGRTLPGPVGLRASTFAEGTGWTPPVAVEPAAAGVAVCCPSLGVDGFGGAVAASLRLLSGGHVLVWANRLDKATGWQGGQRIQADTGSDANAPALAVAPAGDAVAVWTQFDGRAGTVWAHRLPSGSAWSPGQTEISERPAGNAYPPRAVADASGNVIVAWGDPSGVWANRFEPPRGWLGAQEIGSAGFFPVIAFDPLGRAIVAWGAQDGVWTNAFTPGQGWGVETKAFSANAPTMTGIGTDDQGDVLLAFSSEDLTTLRFGAWAARFQPGSGWQDPLRLDSDPSSVASGDPGLGVDPQGNAFAVWASGQDLWARRYAPGPGWASPVLLGQAQGHALGVDPLGNALVLWVGAPDGALRSARYLPAPPG